MERLTTHEHLVAQHADYANTPDPTVMVTVRMTASMRERLKTLASRRGVSMNTLAVALLEAELDVDEAVQSKMRREATPE